MRSLSIIAMIAMIAFVIIGAASNAHAAPTIAYDNEDFHCNVTSANDLHITYFSDAKMRLLEHYDDGFPNFTATPTGPDSTTWDCVWSDTTINFCDWVHVGVKFWVENQNKLNKTNIYWTLNGTPVTGGDRTGPGFEVRPPWGRASTIVYTLRNSGLEIITLRNVQFRISDTETPLPDMMYPVGGTGWQPHPDIVLNPGDSLDVVFNVKQIRPPYYVMAQGEVEVGGNIEGHFIQQHEHPVGGIPTLNQWGLIILLLLLVTAGAVVVRRRQRSTA